MTDKNIKNHKLKKELLPKDPELGAKKDAKEEGFKFKPSKFLQQDKNETVLVDGDGTVLDKNILKVLKKGREERKARSRGVSGCSIKKEGTLEGNVVADEELNKYSTFIVKDSEVEIRQVVGEYLVNGKLDDALMDSLHKFCGNKHTSSRLTKDIVMHSIVHGADGIGKRRRIELGVKLIGELINHEHITEEILTEVMGDLANSLDSLMVDSPKIDEALAIFMAKLVHHKIWAEKTVKLMAGRASIIEKCYNKALALAKNHKMAQPPVGPYESTETQRQKTLRLKYGGMHYRDLQKEAKNNSLPAKGKKEDLIQRLIEWNLNTVELNPEGIENPLTEPTEHEVR